MPSLFPICGVITVGALSNFHRLAQHSLLRRCIRIFYGYVLGYCISSQKFFRLMHTQYNWQLILFDSATLHVVDAQMLQSLYSFASLSHKVLNSVICVNTLRQPSRSISVHHCHRICIPSVISNLFLVRLSIPFNIKMAYCFILVILFEGALRICAQSLQWIFVFQLIQVVILMCIRVV